MDYIIIVYYKCDSLYNFISLPDLCCMQQLILQGIFVVESMIKRSTTYRLCKRDPKTLQYVTNSDTKFTWSVYHCIHT